MRCSQCGEDFEIAPPFSNDPVTCPACGYVFAPQPPVDPNDDEVIEVGESDVVESDDQLDGVVEVNVQPIDDLNVSESDEVPASVNSVSASAPISSPPKPPFNPLLAAISGAGAALFLVAIAGLGWWVISREGLPQSDEALADLGVIESTEMPWDVADANRHLRHNKEPVEAPSKESEPAIASEPAEKSDSNTVQTFQRNPTEAEVQARIKKGKEPTPASTPTPARRPEQDRARVIEEIKSATVFILVETSAGVQTGSGFVFQRNNNWGTIVTNVHVIEPEEGRLKEIKCVFFSGTNREFEVTAKVSCKDKQSDLAFLKVYHDKIPAPISPAKDGKVHETSTVLAAGFPFGEVLKTNRRNPSITITKSAVSSLRYDDFDAVLMLQMDGGLNPGNSGGPVVLEDGRLVGVAVSKIRGTSIGFAIPTQILQQTVLGRLTGASVEKTDKERGRHQFKIDFVDPNSNVKSGELVVFRRSDQTVHFPDSDGLWGPAAERLLASNPLRVRTFTQHGTSLATAELDIPSEPKLMFQVRIGRRGGGEHWSQPIKLPNPLRLGVVSIIPLGGASDEPETGGKKKGKPTFAVLPAMMSDFALNPSTGNIACLDPIQDEIYLIPTDELESADFSLSPKVGIGEGAVSVVYKRHQAYEYFVVACSQDSEIYLLSADSLELVKTIPVGTSRLSRVIASTNQDDPFVYYSYGSDVDSRVGAIDLRGMTDCGKVLDRSTDCTISADGRFAYRRRSPSSLEIESLRMISEFSARAPIFVQPVGDRRAGGGCVPGPFGQITALGTRIYSAGLGKHLETMDFSPICFFRSRPVIVGLFGSQLGSQRKLSLRAASLNTFLSTTSAFEIPAGLVHYLTRAQRTGQRQSDSSPLFIAARIFADDHNQQVVYASRDKIAVIPLDTFALRDDEPLMTLTSETAELQVGEEGKIELRTAHPEVSIEVGELPLGMKQIVNGLSWRPKNEDVGITTIPITLTFDDIERIVDFQVHVRQPSIRTSIDVVDFVVDPNLAFYVCWSGKAEEDTRTTRREGNDGNGGSELCVIPLDNKSEPISKELSLVIKQAVLLGNRVALLPADENQQVYILNLETLEREKLLLSSLPVESIEVRGDEFLLHGDKGVDVYSVESLRRLRHRDGQETPSRPRALSQQILVDGELVDGVLRDRSDSQPMLIVAPGQVPTLPSSQESLIAGQFLRRFSPAHDSLSDRGGSLSSNLVVAGPVAIPNAHLQVSLENRIDEVQDPDIDFRQEEQRVSLLVAGEDGVVAARVPIFRELMGAGVPARRPVMRVVGGEVIIGCGSRIYRWNSSSIESQTEDVSPTNRDPPPDQLHFVPKQSVFIVTDSTASLSHEVSSGSPPYDLHLMTRLGGVELNEKTGEVTLSRDSLLQEAGKVLASAVEGLNGDDAAQELKNRSLEWGEAFERFTGRTLTGFPIAVPIHLKASDSQGAVAEIQYFVLVDIPLDEAEALAAIPSGQ